MRHAAWILAVLLTASAQAAPVVEDDPDVALYAGGVQLIEATGARDSMDMLGLEIEERPTHFDFHILTVDTQAESDAFVPDITVAAEFRHNDRQFRLEIHTSLFFATLERPAFLYWKSVDERFWSDNLELDFARVDHERSAWIVTVPRELLADGNGTLPVLGHAFEDLFLVANSPATAAMLQQIPGNLAGGVNSRAEFLDRMPDDDAIRYDVKFGQPQDGLARLDAEEALRASNGEANTFVYWVTAQNLADAMSTFDLVVQDVPETWTVSLPAKEMQIEGNGDRRFPVIVQTTMAHDHGEYAGFILELQHQDDPKTTGRTDLGIIYNSVPQPAGHHDTIHFWTRDDTMDLAYAHTREVMLAVHDQSKTEVPYMSAATEDSLSLERPADWLFWPESQAPVGDSRFVLEIPLRPQLQMGLDMRPEEDGLLRVSMDAPGTVETLRLSGELVLLDEDGDRIVLASLAPTDIDRLDDDPTEFEIPMDVKEAADYVPYAAGRSLVLELEMISPQVAQGYPTHPWLGPRWLPGATLWLPLDEYYDPIQEILPEGSLRIEPDVEHLHAPAGDQVRFGFRILNEGPAQMIHLSTSGADAALASLDRSTLEIDAGSDRSGHLDLQVPRDAKDGDVLRVLLIAGSEAGEDLALQEFRVTVDDEAEPDPSPSSDKRSPGLGLAWLLVLAAFLRRR